ncbi:MAG: alpha-hydroxy acid oxidase [Hyphomicrobiaceae bacterium]
MSEAQSAALRDRYPMISDLAARAYRRIPFFAWEYLDSGTGHEMGVHRNSAAMHDVLLTPKLMRGSFSPKIETNLFGIEYSAPFGMAPVGLTGLMWPAAECILAQTADKFRIPFTLGTVATETPETIGPLVGGMGWFQLYPPRDERVRKDLLERARSQGFTTLLVTADVPTGSSRERQRKAGVSVPPKWTLEMFYRCLIRPHWSLATLRHGVPRFRTLERYVPGRDMRNMTEFIGEGFAGTLDWDYLRAVRREWDGPIVLKGLLDLDDVRRALDEGIDGIGVSNHGSRQTDAAPAAINILPHVKDVVCDRAKILFDSGVRSGLDIARALALGADFVLLGRAFLYGVAALGKQGADHTATLLRDDLANNMKQLGCAEIRDLPNRCKQAVLHGRLANQTVVCGG